MGRLRTLSALAVAALSPWLVSGVSRVAPYEPGEHEELGFEIAGCERATRSCEVPRDGVLRVVAHGRRGTIEAAPSRLPCRSRGGGPFAEGPSPLTVKVGSGEPFLCVRDGASLVEVPLARATRSEWYERARSARAAGKLAEARALAEVHARDGGLEGARALGLLGRLAMANGDTRKAAELLAQALSLRGADDPVVEEADDRFALAYTLATHEGRYDEARRVLDAAVLGAPGDVRAKRAYYRAVVEHQAGNVRRALAVVGEAKELLSRQGLGAELVDAVEIEALVLLRVGRLADAKAVLLDADRRFSSTTRPCTRATRLTNVALAMLRAYEWEGTGHSGELTEALGYAELALAIGDRSCPGGLRHANAQLQFAHAALLLGRVPLARAALDDARGVLSHPSSWFLARWHELRARVLLAEGDPSEAARELRLALANAKGPHETWALQELRGRALLRVGDRRGAVTALREAEDALDDVVAASPLGDGRAKAASLRGESARLLVDALLDAGDASGAFEAARRARSRALASSALASRLPRLSADEASRLEEGLAEIRRELDADDAEASSSWALPSSELEARERRKAEREQARRRRLDALVALTGQRRASLPEIAPEVVTIFPFRRGERLLTFVATRTSVKVHEARETSTLEALLGPLTGDVARARRARILATGDTAQLGVHALPLGGVPLALRIPTVYALDIERPDVPPGEGALLVADPSGNLPYAREEISRVERSLGAARPSILQQGEATRANVERDLEGRSLFYFAGHAKAGGLDGNGSAIALAEGTRLTVSDVLRSRRPPVHVVLSACEAARDEGTQVASLGLAQAFVLAGSHSVLAPDVEVPDRAAMELATRVISVLGHGDVATALVSAFRDDPPHEVGMLRAYKVIGP